MSLNECQFFLSTQFLLAHQGLTMDSTRGGESGEIQVILETISNGCHAIFLRPTFHLRINTALAAALAALIAQLPGACSGLHVAVTLTKRWFLAYTSAEANDKSWATPSSFPAFPAVKSLYDFPGVSQACHGTSTALMQLPARQLPNSMPPSLATTSTPVQASRLT